MPATAPARGPADGELRTRRGPRAGAVRSGGGRLLHVRDPRGPPAKDDRVPGAPAHFRRRALEPRSPNADDASDRDQLCQALIALRITQGTAIVLCYFEVPPRARPRSSWKRKPPMR